MRAGDLRHQVEIQTETVTGVGQRGQPIRSWATTATVPAAIEDLQGRKLEIARQLLAEASHEVRIRYIPGVSPKTTRLVYNGRVFNVGNVSNKGENNFTLILTCMEQVT